MHCLSALQSSPLSDGSRLMIVGNCCLPPVSHIISFNHPLPRELSFPLSPRELSSSEGIPFERLPEERAVSPWSLSRVTRRCSPCSHRFSVFGASIPVRSATAGSHGVLPYRILPRERRLALLLPAYGNVLMLPLSSSTWEAPEER